MLAIKNNLIENVDFYPSPHCDERTDESDISLLVIHNISLPPGNFTGHAVRDFFMGQLKRDEHPYFQSIGALRVSAHLFIRRSGEVLQFVAFNRRAWHAGVSQFRGRERCNDFSIGVELEGTDDQIYSELQYQQLAKVSAALMECYPKLTQDRIVGHSDIAPDRKTDPGPCFDWDYYRQLIQSYAG